jgi:hypothetical protein
MPGYLSNRLISLDIVNQLEELDTDLAALDSRVTEAEANIDDLSLNLGV